MREVCTQRKTSSSWSAPNLGFGGVSVLVSFAHPVRLYQLALLTFWEEADAWLRAVCYTLVYPSVEPLQPAKVDLVSHSYAHKAAEHSGLL
jgi:hypothetical protein